jgi:hypothetical protein
MYWSNHLVLLIFSFVSITSVTFQVYWKGFIIFFASIKVSSYGDIYAYLRESRGDRTFIPTMILVGLINRTLTTIS